MLCLYADVSEEVENQKLMMQDEQGMDLESRQSVGAVSLVQETQLLMHKGRNSL